MAVKLLYLLAYCSIISNNALGHKLLHKLNKWNLGFFEGTVSRLVFEIKFSTSSLKQTSQSRLKKTSKDSTTLFPAAICHYLQFFRAFLGLNFSTLCCKRGQFPWNQLEAVFFKVCFSPQAKFLDHSSKPCGWDSGLHLWITPPLLKLDAW